MTAGGWTMRTTYRFLVFATLAATSSTAWAQYGGLSGSSGMFGSRTMGQAMGGAARNFSGGRNTGMGMGSGMGLGSGMGIGSGMGMGMGSSSFGNAQFRFATRRQGDFVGADSRDINPSILGGLTGTTGGAGTSGGTAYGTSGSGTVGGSMGATRQGSGSYRGYGRRSRLGNYGTATTSQGPALGLDMSFEVQSVPDDKLSAATTKSLAQAMRLPPGAPVEVSVQGGTAVLRGVVATPHDRALAEQLVLLEPGIVRVTNELQVAPHGATLGKAPTPGSSRPTNPETPPTR